MNTKDSDIKIRDVEFEYLNNSFQTNQKIANRALLKDERGDHEDILMKEMKT